MKLSNYWRANFIWLLAAVVIYGAGCWPTGSRYPKYDSEFVNATDVMIDDVQITWTANGENFRQRAGIVSPGVNSSATMAFSPDPIPDRVLATWRTADGKTHEQIVEVASRIPDIQHFTGSVIYLFTNDGVTVQAKRE